ncbi:MAG: hypothetical protein RLZZ609_2580 [Cyanobacteriota bacterium]|jgi:hypothetical protein
MQGAAAQWALHEDDGTSQSNLQPIAKGKGAFAHGGTRGQLTEEEATLAHSSLQVNVLVRVDPFKGRPQNTYRGSLPLQTALMNGPINSCRQPADHRPAPLGQNAPNLTSNAQPMA